MKRIAFAALALAACSQPAPPPDAPKTDVAAPATKARSDADVAAKIAALPAPYNAGVYENGRRAFLQCKSCHTVEPGGVNRVGPALHGMFGRAAGAAPGFRYSDALKASGIVWDEAKLDAWVEDPRTLVPGNNMIYPGLRKAEDRRDLVAYLKVEAE
jgi:cytochrome c